MRGVKFVSWAVACVLALMSFTASASLDLASYPLRGLEASGVEARSLPADVDVLVLFEPECTWCFKQVRVLNRLQQQCASFRAAGVGVNGSRRALLAEVRRLRADFPLYEASQALLADLGQIPGTPLMIYIDQSGQFENFSRGFQSESLLIKRLANSQLAGCQFEN